MTFDLRWLQTVLDLRHRTFPSNVCRHSHSVCHPYVINVPLNVLSKTFETNMPINKSYCIIISHDRDIQWRLMITIQMTYHS